MPLQLVIDNNPVVIPPLAALQRLKVVPNVREARHHVRVCLPLDVFGFPQHLPNYHTDNGQVDHEYLLDCILSKEAVQRLLQRKWFLEEGLLASIICGMVLLLALRMLFVMVLHVAVYVKGQLEVLGVDCAPSLRSDLLFADEVHAEEALDRHD